MDFNSVLLFTIAAVSVIAVGVFIALQVNGRSPEKRERKRLQQIHERGRLGDAFITEANEATIYYEYTLQGVHYSTSQDVSALRSWLPDAPEQLIGIAHLKYMPRNPANSILVCESWSGLRFQKSAAAS